SGPGGGNRAAANQIEGEIASRENESTEDSSSGAQRFHEGIHRGPVKGPRGAEVPIIARAGEWVLTDEQKKALTSGRSGGSSTPARAVGGDPIDYDRLAAAMSRVSLSVPVSSIAKGLHDSRRR
ncbi:MAG TPA: hypothetical protein VF228_22640, partial [Iamia sp.]